jgi:hypothetical protein
VARVIGQAGIPDGPHGGVLRVSSYEQVNPVAPGSIRARRGDFK